MTLSRAEISALAHADHPIACPFSQGTVDSLIDGLGLSEGARALDIGCGMGAWLDAMTSRRAVVAIGVDLAAPSLDVARERLAARRVTLVKDDAAAFMAANPGTFEAVLCNGSTHALGGFRQTLEAVHRALAPTGVALVSDGFWQSPPSPDALLALDATIDEFPDLDGLKAIARETGFAVSGCHVSSMEEWDEYEDSWCQALERRADDPDLSADIRAQLAEAAASHRGQYRQGYRGFLGFAALTLRKG